MKPVNSRTLSQMNIRSKNIFDISFSDLVTKDCVTPSLTTRLKEENQSPKKRNNFHNSPRSSFD